MQRWQAREGSLSSPDLEDVVAVLLADGVVALPTETYYGLAAHWQRPVGLEAIARLKRRRVAAPLLLLVSGLSMAEELAADRPPRLRQLAAAFWPGPLTLVLRATSGLHPALVGADGGVAVRHCPHPVVQRLLDTLDAPVTGTSANVTGDPPTCSAADIRLAEPQLLSGVIDSGPTPGGPPSTLLDLRPQHPRVVRRGAVEVANLQRVLGERLL